MPKCAECKKPFDRGVVYWQRFCSPRCQNTNRCRAYRKSHPEKMAAIRRARKKSGKH